MDGKLLYVILTNVLLFAAGASAVGVWFAVQGRKFIRRWWAYALAKVGVVLTNGILMVRLFPLGVVEPEPIAYYYTAGMLITAIGVSFVAGDLARRGGKERARDEVIDAVVDHVTKGGE